MALRSVNTSAPTSIDPRTLAKLSGLRLRARHIVEGYVAGLHHSPYHGFSIEFAEHREYAPGDDLRYVDWKVFGRTDKVYLKQYEDETNLRLLPRARRQREHDLPEPATRRCRSWSMPSAWRPRSAGWCCSSKTRWAWRRSTARFARWSAPPATRRTWSSSCT